VNCCFIKVATKNGVQIYPVIAVQSISDVTDAGGGLYNRPFGSVAATMKSQGGTVKIAVALLPDRTKKELAAFKEFAEGLGLKWLGSLAKKGPSGLGFEKSWPYVELQVDGTFTLESYQKLLLHPIVVDEVFSDLLR
jgi:hypothetical protein